MWLTSDGRVNSVALPDDHEPAVTVKVLLSDASPRERALMDEEFEVLFWLVADALDEIVFNAADEAPFVGTPVPVDVLNNVNWLRLLGPDKHTEVLRVELRWRLEIIEIVRQAIADLD
jgi:hypothetical protein